MREKEMPEKKWNPFWTLNYWRICFISLVGFQFFSDFVFYEMAFRATQTKFCRPPAKDFNTLDFSLYSFILIEVLEVL